MHSVWVIAPTATDSDALSTAFFVLGPGKTREFCLHHPELEVMMVHSEADDGALAVTHILPDSNRNLNRMTLD
jgi:thiamine biosynthesis lipoprotein